MASRAKSTADRLNGRGLPLEDLRDLEVLDAVAGDAHITQRSIASRLGIALGLTNLYVKRLVRKGYIKCVNVQPNRLRYLITPTGVAEKTRLTYEFMQYSLYLYSQVRRHLGATLQQYAVENRRHIALYGTGEAAELAYLAITELGLDLVAIFDGETSKQFLGQRVRPIQEHRDVAFDLLVVATLERSDRIVEQLVQLGVERERLVTLRR